MVRLRYIWKHRILKIPHRIKYGFWPSDLWNLDVELAKWLGTRLVELSKVTNGAPCGYPEYDDSMTEDTDFEAWERHLLMHGLALDGYADSAYLAFSAEDGAEVRHRADQAMQWVAKWWGHLWW